MGRNVSLSMEMFFCKEQGDVFFCLIPLKYTRLQGHSKKDTTMPVDPKHIPMRHAAMAGI
jgi:hypothetical protein